MATRTTSVELERLSRAKYSPRAKDWPERGQSSRESPAASRPWNTWSTTRPCRSSTSIWTSSVWSKDTRKAPEARPRNERRFAWSPAPCTLIATVPLKCWPSVRTPVSVTLLIPSGILAKPLRGNLTESETLSTEVGPERSGATVPRRNEPGTIRSADQPSGVMRAEIHCPWLPELSVEGVSDRAAVSVSAGGGGGGGGSTTVAH